MKNTWTCLLLIFYTCFLLVCGTGVKYYTNRWYVHVPMGDLVANQVAQDNDMECQGPDFHNDGFYVMVKVELPTQLPSHVVDITRQLNNHHLVTTAYQDVVKERSDRSVVPRHVVPRGTDLSQSTQVVQENDEPESNYARAFNDDQWDDQWYFQDFRQNLSQPVLDMNVVPVFFELKITGESVNITVPDDGLEYHHVEIIGNFNAHLSWNLITNSSDILPDGDGQGGLRSHGTRCAGEIAMKPNNKICGVGTAYGAQIGGIKFLDGASTDTRESKVLKYAVDHVNIYSNSWGPADTGTYMEHLTDFVKKSLSKGIYRGRDGKGVIYVFAAGNGKADGDNCACDGYVNSIYTVVVASCDDSGHVTHYSERCASIMATAYSGSGLEKNVLTTDVKGQCTDTHTGTSAAAPLVSGIIALALSANPSLTWRDVQHLIAWSSQVAPLSDNYGWNRNKAGFYYSVDFGFGLVNAYKLVTEALKWENVPEMASCAIRMPNVKELPVTRNSAARVIVNTDSCEGKIGEVKYIEFVQLVITMTYSKRGDIQVAMRSPLGTEVHVLESRRKDYNPVGLNKWTFSVLAFWGESPKGNFIIDVYDTTGDARNNGKILEMTLTIHGTKEAPEVYKNGPRPYDAFTLAKPGDKPRFFHLIHDHVEKTVQSTGEAVSSEKSQTKDIDQQVVQNRNAINAKLMQNANELKRQITNNVDATIKQLQNTVMNLEQESNKRENAIVNHQVRPNLIKLVTGRYDGFPFGIPNNGFNY